MRETRQRRRRIGGSGMLAAGLAGLIAAGLVAGVAGCATADGQSAFRPTGPLVTLRVGVYGDPGYREAGLYTEYERLHPGIKIVQVITAGSGPDAYWRAVRAGLPAGHVADIQAVPVAEISAVTGSLARYFVPLSTLSSGSAGASALSNGWLPWVTAQATSKTGRTYALGAEIGPLAICYRTSLLAEAGLPSSPRALARDWSTWPGYLRTGRLFRSRITHGPAFTDSAVSLYNAMAAQVREQYYSPAGHLVLASNRAVKKAFYAAAGAARGGLTARLTPGSRAWARGVAHVAFATTVCPAWMLHQISALAGPLGAHGWNVLPAPGGSGNAGGFYLALPRAGRHQQAAFQLAEFLAGEQAGETLFRTQGDFPANFAAATSLDAVTSPYFSGADVGKIFGAAASRTPATILGPASAEIASSLDGGLARMGVAGAAAGRGVAGGVSVGGAWRAAVREALAAAAH